MILFVLWALGLVTSCTIGGYIHILLVVAVIVVLVRVIRGGGSCEAPREEARRRSVVVRFRRRPFARARGGDRSGTGNTGSGGRDDWRLVTGSTTAAAGSDEAAGYAAREAAKPDSGSSWAGAR